MSEADDLGAEHARAAAQIEADVSVEPIAGVYARALLGAAEAAGLSEEVLGQFDLLVGDVLARFRGLEAVLSSGLVSVEEKAGILDRVFGGRFSPLLINFLKVVARHGRLDCLGAIHRRMRQLQEEHRGLVRVEVTTARPLGSRLADRIAAGLHTIVSGEPLVGQHIDPKLIGGVVVRVGDTVYDGSLANQLQKICQQMIDRSAYEIQSRRNSFSDPAGN